MKKLLLIIILVLILSAIGIFVFQKWYFNSAEISERQEKVWNARISNNQYREYIPIVFQQDQLMDARDLLTRKHVKNMIHVLKFYGEKWKIQNDKLMISNDIDRKISWNYTTKANDSIWLAEHPVEK